MTKKEELKILRKSVKSLRKLLVVQCASGNWDCNPYMHGMANGMILSLSLFDDKRPEYLNPPEVWLDNDD